MKLLLAGATGLVGRHVLDLALADPRVESIAAPVRRALPPQPKLLAPVVDFDDLPGDAPWWRADAVICALGTTMRTAGGQAAFRRVDHDYPLAIADLALRAGASAYVLNSAIGADSTSRFFYNRVKGELEQALSGRGYRSLTFVRPGLIGGERDEFRAGERAMAAVLRLAGPVLPRRWRINPAATIARAMLEAAIAARPGLHVIGADQLA
ncbi:NAD-dependent dehydratase [Achromobacter spanius]|uniref:NAD-dependent dehydratase n=1 Tax=Achromobacter spanius TaxID=217203 RepID=UPI0032088E85